MTETRFSRAKANAGIVLITLGVLVFGHDVDRAALQLKQSLTAVPGEVLLNLLLAGCGVGQAYAADHLRFLQSLLQHVLMVGSPPLMVFVGSVLSRDEASSVSPHRNREIAGVEIGTRGRISHRYHAEGGCGAVEGSQEIVLSRVDLAATRSTRR